ncbi:nuclear transport factor 2 family protein [Flagellimonas onchidii]|uniref:nuclear transport factor 2 family protein n=1 Tax=Flagellimonas onchidii TaxID=2562684 RepID=UPI0010A64C33|nr:nuclear transport factor 2 family protein [Allomuricauda onchidii]
MNPKFIIALLLSASFYGQVNTEVYLFDLSMENGNPMLTNPKNISNNEGYDNQPSFLDNNTILFSSTRAEQTDIKKFNIEAGSTTSWISNTPTGSEYSPLKIPGKNAVSAIRLDLDGLQLLYEYDLKTGESVPILDQMKIGYHIWYSDHKLISSVLVDNRLDLVMSDLKDGTNRTLQRNIGRSLSKIPNSDLISYISKKENPWQIKSIDPNTETINYISDVPKESEDICWLNPKIILTGAGKSLMKFNVENDVEWIPIMYFEEEEINNISRIATNENRTRLAFVAEESPANIVQQQLDAYNAKDIEAFMYTYSNDIKLYNYPNKLFLDNWTDMKNRYAEFFESTPDLHCKIKNRIVIGNKVIDEEFITANGSNFSAVAIYEVENGKIAKVTFMR